MKSKRRLLATPEKNSTRAAIDALARLLGPVDPREELVEHLWLFNLIGDPLLRLRQPQSLEVRAPAQVAKGQAIEISALMPMAGEATLELVPRRDRLAGLPPRRQKFSTSEAAQAEFSKSYHQANDPVVFRSRARVAAGEATLRCEIPADASGAYECCVFVAGRDDCASGAAAIEVIVPRVATASPSDEAPAKQ
jgi:hypothetical protein